MAKASVIEFTCVECGAYVVDIGATQLRDPPICCLCLWLPGWTYDPQLIRIFCAHDPDRRQALEAKYGDKRD